MRRLSVVLAAAVLGAVVPLSAAQAAPPKPNPAWVKVCTQTPVLSGPWKRFRPVTCRLVLTPPKGGR